MDEQRKQAIQYSWQANATAWTEAVRGQRIESRRLATDRAMLNAIRAHQPRRVLDLGCGEGWLCRALAAEDVETLGLDASAPLIEAARQAHPQGAYRCLTYDALVFSYARFLVPVAHCLELAADPAI